MQKKTRILFLSTGNCTRGAMAEGFLKTLAGEYFQGVSAGIRASEVHPLAIDVMDEVGIDITDQRPKTVTESLRDHFGHVMIFYDPTKERSPIFPFTPHLLRCGIPDPAAAEGSAAEKAEAFRYVRDEIRVRIADFLNEATPSRQEQPALVAA